jgi:hypothetical protein
MPERLPVPMVQVDFTPSEALPDCLRAMWMHARRLQVGLTLFYSMPEALAVTPYVVWPWMSLEDVLALCGVSPAAEEEAVSPAVVSQVAAYRAQNRGVRGG